MVDGAQPPLCRARAHRLKCAGTFGPHGRYLGPMLGPKGLDLFSGLCQLGSGLLETVTKVADIDAARHDGVVETRPQLKNLFGVG